MADGRMPRIRELARAEFARRTAVAEADARMLAPLCELAEELREVDIDARFEPGEPTYGSDLVVSTLRLPRIHRLGEQPVGWEADELVSVLYEVTLDTRDGHVSVCDAVPGPDEDPDAYEQYGAAPDPTWHMALTAGRQKGRRSLAEFAEDVRQLAVRREMGRLGPQP